MSSQGATVSTSSNRPPVIRQVIHTPDVPGTADTVCVTAQVSDDSSVVSVTLAYANEVMQSQTNVVFLETMRASDIKPWSGDGCDNGWTVAWSGTNPFEQRASAQYGDGNPYGLEFKLGTANLIDSMVTTTQGIDARGMSGYIQFWLWADGLAGDMGWTFQLDHGSGYSTRLSELVGANHGWQLYHYDLQPDELVSNLFLRFQFRRGSGDPRIDLDRLSAQVVSAGGDAASLAMLDDGAHQDGASGDGLYGANIPPHAEETIIYYYLTVIDDSGAATFFPAAAPAVACSYTVSAAALDSVGDGIPDWWRARYFGGDGTATNSESCAECDPDGDGDSNRQEYIADTDPTNDWDYFLIWTVLLAQISPCASRHPSTASIRCATQPTLLTENGTRSPPKRISSAAACASS